MKKKDQIHNLLNDYNNNFLNFNNNRDYDYGPNLWFFNAFLRLNKCKITFKPIIQILDHSEDWLSFIDIGILFDKNLKKYYLVYSDYNTKDYDGPIIIKDYKSLSNNSSIKKSIFSVLKKKRLPDLKMVCNMVYLNENFKWNINELVKFFKPFHKYRLKAYKQVEDDDHRAPYQYFCIWLKFVKEEIMKKEPSDSPKYTKVRRCITPEGRVVKNDLNPNKDFN
tara:strand:+ start:108 stop:776 length:669 start_codon:yes stop_codon:yes gene_type:complete